MYWLVASRVAAEGRPLGALEIVCEDPEGVGILDPPLVEVSEPSLPVEEEAGQHSGHRRASRHISTWRQGYGAWLFTSRDMLRSAE